jgi:[ribosomal protein S18]-alanine N-acetyltransferase
MATAPEHFTTAPEVTIRPMTEADVAAVVAIEFASYQFPWSEGVFRDCVRVGYICRAIEIDSLVIGYAVMSLGAGELHILNLCVHPDYRCRGIGQQLLQHLLDRGRASNASEAYLEVRPSNISAIRLYHSLGFRQIGIRRGYYQAVGGREDAAVLKRDLKFPD